MSLTFTGVAESDPPEWPARRSVPHLVAPSDFAHVQIFAV